MGLGTQGRSEGVGGHGGVPAKGHEKPGVRGQQVLPQSREWLEKLYKPPFGQPGAGEAKANRQEAGVPAGMKQWVPSRSNSIPLKEQERYPEGIQRRRQGEMEV